MANKNWVKMPLKKLCTRIGDGLHGTPEYSPNTKIFFINGNNLQNGKIEITKDTKTVTESELAKNFIPLDKNTLLLSINGTLGSMAFYNNEKVMLGKSAAYLNFKNDINRFYYYYFQLNGVQNYFYNVATGSTIKNLSLKSIQDFEVPVPKKEEWNGIVNILSSIDEKIELNNKINQELEAIVKTLYDYWFVQFDFPNELCKPYKSSGGKMVFSKELRREIPEGWEVKKLGDYTSIKKGTLITENAADSSGKVKVVSAGIDFSYYHSEANYSENTITISASGANAGFINFWREPIFACDCTTVRGENTADTLHILGFLKMRQEYLYKQARGSAQPHVYPKDIEGLTIPIPPSKIIEQFGKFVVPNNEQISNNLKQNQQLTELRDWLLPMLMNGQVTIREAEERLSMAAEPQIDYKENSD